jgi:hypothetical protein
MSGHCGPIDVEQPWKRRDNTFNYQFNYADNFFPHRRISAIFQQCSIENGRLTNAFARLHGSIHTIRFNAYAHGAKVYP